MIRALQIRMMLLSWLALLTAVFAVAPEHGMQFVWISAGLGAVGLAFLFPDAALILSMGSLMLGFENFLFFYNFNLNHDGIFASSTFHKALSLALLIPAIARYGLRPQVNYGILALTAMLIASFVAATRLPTLDDTQMIQTYVGLSIPLIVFNMRFNPRSIDSHMAILAWLPVLSIALGLLAQWAHLMSLDGIPWNIFELELMTGSNRLAGVNIPAALAALAYVSFFVSIFQAVLYGKKGYYAMAAIAFLITVLTGGRGPLGAEILFAGLGITISSNRELGGRVKINFAITAALVIALALALYWPNLAARFGSGETATGQTEVLNTSGRSQIWDVEFAAWQKNPVFGRGMGAGAVILLDNSWHNLVAARATHNEYLRLLLDGGIVGLISYFLGFVFLIVRECRDTGTTAKRLTFTLFLSFAIWSFFDNTISSGWTLITFYAVALLLFQARLAERRRQLEAPA
jgi:O-antigen ligase